MQAPEPLELPERQRKLKEAKAMVIKAERAAAKERATAEAKDRSRFATI